MRRVSLIVPFFLVSIARGQAPVLPKAVVVSPAGDSVPAGYPVMLDATSSVMDTAQPLQWQVVRPPGLVIGTFDKGPRQGVAALFATLPKQDANYTIAVTAVVVDPSSHEVKVDTSVVDIHAEYTPPIPPGPVPPVPPVPPGPVPVPPTPVPTPGKLNRVVMVYESSANMTFGQIRMMNSTAVRYTLSSKLPKDGTMPAWRCWDKDVDVSRETSGWQQAWGSVKAELATQPLPCVVLFDDKGGHAIVPLPETEDAFLSLIGKQLGLR